MIQQNKTLNSNSIMLKMIREKSEEGKSMIGIRELLGTGKYDNLNSIKHLFLLLEEGIVETTENRRDKEDLYICYVGTKKKKMSVDNQDGIKKLITLFQLYCLISKKPSITDFHLLTDKRFSDHSFFVLMKQTKVCFTEIKIMLYAINSFVTGDNSIFMSDMSLNAEELAYYSEQFVDKKNVLLQQDLLKIQLDPDGICCRVSVTKRTLQLIQNIPLSMQFEKKKKNFGLYVYKPYSSISDKKMYYNPSTCRLFDNVTRLIKKSDSPASLNITLLLYGPSGTGKTEFAYQMARKLGSDIMQFEFSQIQSKWIGETEKNIKSVFNNYFEQLARTEKPLILLMNEADGLMNRRVSVNNSNDVYANHAQAQLLETLEEFTGILIATTNMYQNIDSAFHRRFLFKCKIDMPDTETKELLLKDSFLINYMDEPTKQDLYDSNWSAAQLRNLECKIKQLELMDELSMPLIRELMTDEGLLNTSKIGY